MGKYVATQKEVARHGVSINGRVPKDVYHGIVRESERMKVRTSTLVAQIVCWWQELVSCMGLDVVARLQGEARRTGRSVPQVIAQIVTWWHEDCVKADAVKHQQLLTK
jgi:hypothetical protein